jgi:hypothetical protein
MTYRINKLGKTHLHRRPDLGYWTSLGEEGQQKFIMDGIFKACENLGITTDDT